MAGASNRFRIRHTAVAPAGILIGVAVATTALVYFGVQSIRYQASLREGVRAATAQAVADLAVARLDTAILETDQAIASVNTSASLVNLQREIAALEAARPWAAPIALVPAGRRSTTPFRPNADVAGAFALAELVEQRDRRPAQAADLYHRLATSATTANDRIEAIGREARSHLASGNRTASALAYRRLLASVNVTEGHQVAWAARAHSNLRSLAAPGDPGAVTATLDFIEFLDTCRFLLDHDQEAFYRTEAERWVSAVSLDGPSAARRGALRQRATRLTAIGQPLGVTAGPARPSGFEYQSKQNVSVTYQVVDGGTVVRTHPLTGSATAPQLAHLWSREAVASLADHVRSRSEDTSGESFLLLHPGDDTQPDVSVAASATTLTAVPGWRVGIRRSASSQTSDPEVVRYTVLVGLLLVTVVLALVLSVRSVVRAARLSQLRAEFVSSVSHELRTPLSLIRMFADSLRAGWVAPDKHAEYHDVIARESERLTDLVNNVLGFSHVESGARRYVPEPVDLRHIVEPLLERYAYHLKVAGVTLVKDLPPEPVVCRIDREAIEQTIANLLSNAVKYIGSGANRTREVRVALRESDGWASLLISDTGIGIPRADLGRIFDRFHRVDDERVRAVGGSGLGLTLVRAHVEAHGGTIAVESELDHGSAFTVRLPLVPRDARA